MSAETEELTRDEMQVFAFFRGYPGKVDENGRAFADYTPDERAALCGVSDPKVADHFVAQFIADVQRKLRAGRVVG